MYFLYSRLYSRMAILKLGSFLKAARQKKSIDEKKNNRTITHAVFCLKENIAP